MSKLTLGAEILQLPPTWAKYSVVLSVSKGMVYPHCEVPKENWICAILNWVSTFTVITLYHSAQGKQLLFKKVLIK